MGEIIGSIAIIFLIAYMIFFIIWDYFQTKKKRKRIEELLEQIRKEEFETYKYKKSN